MASGKSLVSNVGNNELVSRLTEQQKSYIKQ
jgi:hypothetical protein